MRLLAFEAMWGLGGTLKQQLHGIKERGYDGVETGLPEVMARLGVITTGEVPDFPHLLRDLELSYLPMIFTYDPSFSSRWAGIAIEPGATHITTFQHQAEAAMKYEPMQLTAHSGSDSMTFSESMKFFQAAVAVESDVGIPIGHETHRMRILYSPFAWREVHRELPELRTVADFSHWVNVCERIPDDLDDLVASCAERAVHIHGRVGHPEGPQVNDPRAPEHEPVVQWHEKWWRTILSHRLRSGEDVATFDPEYGPAPYLPCLPFSGTPVTDLLKIRLWERTRIQAIWDQLTNLNPGDDRATQQR